MWFLQESIISLLLQWHTSVAKRSPDFVDSAQLCTKKHFWHRLEPIFKQIVSSSRVKVVELRYESSDPQVRICSITKISQAGIQGGPLGLRQHLVD